MGANGNRVLRVVGQILRQQLEVRHDLVADLFRLSSVSGDKEQKGNRKIELVSCDHAVEGVGRRKSADPTKWLA